MKKEIYLSIAALVVLAIVFAFFFRKNNSAPGVSVTSPNNLSSLLQPVSLDKIPKSQTITLGTKRGSVEVENFYKIATGQEGDTFLLKSTDKYKITYDAIVSSFWILITAEPVDTYLKSAQSDLLQILGIDESNACSLNISWSVSPEIDKNLAGKSSPLSFCAGAL